MHTRFFLTSPYSLEKSRGRSLGSIGSASHASTHMPKKEPHETLTFTYAIEKIGRACSGDHYSNTGADATLIFIDDTVTFQIESVAVVNNSFCTYNTETKLIGFGSDVYEAKNITDETNSKHVGFGVMNNISSDKMFDFTLPPSIPEFDKYSYLVPDAFYESVLNELIPYIEFAKLEKFKRVTTEIMKKPTQMDSYINNFFDETATAPSLDFTLVDFILAVRMFLDDDPVLLKNKCYMENNYICMSVFIRSIQRLTNETF